MRRFDKKIHMEKANKLFQERNNSENGSVDENIEITYMQDIYPSLSKIIKNL